MLRVYLEVALELLFEPGAAVSTDKQKLLSFRNPLIYIKVLLKTVLPFLEKLWADLLVYCVKLVPSKK